jgi:5-oxoprolinase (ATP-hydrolysing)
MPVWTVSVDTGGTFTDCIAVAPDGTRHRAKVLSSSALRATVVGSDGPNRLRIRADWLPADAALRGLFLVPLIDGEVRPTRVIDARDDLLTLEHSSGPPLESGAHVEIRSTEEAPVLAVRMITRTGVGDGFPPLAMRLATTRGTNALLERRGDAPVLFVTRGFADLLRIGTQQRPDLFALDVRRPPGLAVRAIEVDERLDAAGSVIRGLDEGTLAEAAERARTEGFRSAAVCLMHSFRNPGPEQRAAAILRRLGFETVAVSSDLAPSIGLLDRASTSVVEAYLARIIRGYLGGVAGALGFEPIAEDPPGMPAQRGDPPALLVMTSAGGLARADRYAAKDSLLSGPAGGVVGAARAGRDAGFDRLITFDMGGTSTDVARFDGDFEYVWTHTVGDARLVAPALAIESVAAGGGSVCTLDADGLRVGPESAGSTPGPSCYGAGGPLTVTDANLLLGRIAADRFAVPLAPAAARSRLEEIRTALAERSGSAPPAEPLLEGMLALADERMADAIRRISLRKGYDPRDHALVAFGGAGPQHACSVADRLGIRTVVVPADAGLLSALGLETAVMERFATRQILEPLDQAASRIAGIVATLEEEAATAVVRDGAPAPQVEIRRRIAALRFLGQDSAIEVEWTPHASIGDAFIERYQSVFGHRPESGAVELESLRVVASWAQSPPSSGSRGGPPPAMKPDVQDIWIDGGWQPVPVVARGSLGERGADGLPGPALVTERHTSTLVAPGWRAVAHSSGALVLSRAPVSLEDGGAAPDAAEARPPGPRHVDAVREQLFVHRFEAIVAEMGEQLRRTARSVNVRERLDFSCGLMDADGELIANAPHIPVHLGALGTCVRSVRDALEIGRGDVAVTNHPGFGGSHLPDVTVIAPVLSQDGATVAWVANRAHHAEIGGTRPGSMPPDARSLAEEGVVMQPWLLVRDGRADWDALRDRLGNALHPSRSIEENVADLMAQVAAVRRGQALVEALVAAEGVGEVRAQMAALTARAERRIRDALAGLPDGEYAAVENLDDGSALSVRIRVVGDGAEFDFAGSAPVHPGNLNATPAIVRSAVLYVLRLLIGEPLPLNEGLLRPVRIGLPAGILDPPFPEDPRLAPAVVGGNVETSQRLVDALIRALSLCAGSQGTMNNVLFGNEGFGYYETVGGGAGAGPGWDGESAVHTHMTNTRITDAEVLEHRYPVRVERFAVRAGSGGRGRFHGGDGIVREIRFLEPVSLSLLAQHRSSGPYGMNGGEPGEPGTQRVLRVDGSTEVLGGIDGREMRPGDRLVLESPGGGGWGSPDPVSPPAPP